MSNGKPGERLQAPGSLYYSLNTTCHGFGWFHQMTNVSGARKGV